MTKYAILIGVLLSCLQSFAFRLDPMVVHFTAKGKGATQVLKLDNPTGDKIPVQIEVVTRDEKSGNEKREKTSEFTVYPEQVVLLPHEKRNVRITFSGDLGNEEKSYRIIASQLPVELKETNAKSKKAAGANVTFMLQYVASAYVTPEGASADVKVKDVKLLSPKSLSVVVYNEGTAHRLLYVKSFKVLEKGKVVAEIKKPEGIEGVNLLAKSQKTVVLPLEKALKGTDCTVQMELTESSD